MSLKLIVAGISTAALLAPLPVGAQSSVGYRVSLSVPVTCQVRHNAVGAGYSSGAAYHLGRLNEYCNAPNGYELRVAYTPGALRGMILVAGEHNVVLDGSGQAVVASSNSPRIQERALMAIPGASGFDADRLEFSITPR